MQARLGEESEEKDMYRAFLMSLSAAFLFGLAACGDNGGGGGSSNDGGTSGTTEQPATPPATNK